ncbi:MAG TPA: hypothetical protein PLU71_02180 [Candidatus Dependentiae bacterium]|nr:hypothetical protein [Candidatus Dependentiae bacterium]HRQ62638.1 hypothetical protein [Candidatus Dependentiae bacterium]
MKKTALLLTTLSIGVNSYWLSAMECSDLIDKLEGLAKQVKTGSNFVEATEAVETNMLSNNQAVQHVSFMLSKELFKQQYTPAFETAFQTAQLQLKSDNKDNQAWARIILNELLENKFSAAFDFATQAAQKGMQINYKPILRYSLAIFETLFKNRYAPAFDAAEQAIEQAEKDSSWQMRDRTVNYFDIQDAARKLEDALHNARQK